MTKKITQKEGIPSTKRGLKDGYERVTFIVKDELTYKLNCISATDDVYLKEVVNTALENYVNEWEKRNGKINRRKNK